MDVVLLLGMSSALCQLIGSHLKVQFVFLFRSLPPDWTHEGDTKKHIIGCQGILGAMLVIAVLQYIQ